MRIGLCILVLCWTVTIGAADVVVFEGDVFPELDGWQRIGTFDADRWIASDNFCQFVELGVWAPPPLGEFDGYQRSLAEFAASDAFFIEWKVETGAPASELDQFGIPCAMSAAGTNAANYQFIITDQRVRVIRDNFLPLVLADIDPNVCHTYRLELFNPDSYQWYIDVQLIDWGISEGRYPNPDSVLLWAARFELNEHTTHWDYIRYGDIPVDGSGDFDSDGLVGQSDVRYFLECLDDAETGAGPGCRFSDFDFDGDVDLEDYAAFQRSFGQ